MTNWIEAASYTGYTREVVSLAEECGSDRWAIVQISPMKSALFTGESVDLIPQDERHMILKEYPQ